MDQLNAANQFITLQDLQSFPGQMLAVGAIAEISKRIWTDMPDSMNRVLILVGAVCVNFIVSLFHQGPPTTRLDWSALFLVTLINAFVIALTTMKSIEFVAERKVTEMSKDLASSGVQIQTTVSPDTKALGPDEVEAAPLAPLATVAKDAEPGKKAPEAAPTAAPEAAPDTKAAAAVTPKRVDAPRPKGD